MFLRMKVSGITLDPFTNMPIVILKDLKNEHALPIWIGIAEASAIATELEKISMARPMTHDLMRNILCELSITLERVEVTDLRNNTFYAHLHLRAGGKLHTIDSRPSDAIALALRTDSPIFVAEEVIKKARKVDLGAAPQEEMTDEQKERWAEILENLSPEAFGKYKM